MSTSNSRKILQITQRRTGVNGQPELLIIREGNQVPVWEQKFFDIPPEHIPEILNHFELEESRGKKTQDLTPFNYQEFARPIFSLNRSGKRGVVQAAKNQRELQAAQAKRLTYEEQVSSGKLKHVTGSLAEGDIIAKFKRLRRYQDNNKKSVLEFWVEWKPRNDGVKPEDSIISNDELKANDPGTLIDFYESILEFESEIPGEAEDGRLAPTSEDKENLISANPLFPSKMDIEATTRDCTPASGKSFLEEEKIPSHLQALFGPGTVDQSKRSLDISLMNKKLSEGLDRPDVLYPPSTSTKIQQRNTGNYISESSESQSN